jgi:hypothetical protein
MADDLSEQLARLERALIEMERASKQALGFISSIHYRGVAFNVSRRFVIADLSPLAFFHLVEHIDADGADAAVMRLHHRLLPLLSCRHQWTELKRHDDAQVRSMARDADPYVCKSCTAYVMKGPGASLPVVGRIAE